MSQSKQFSLAERARLNWIWIATAMSVAVGAILRIRQYLAGRSLWIDEAMLALNILNRSYEGLFKKLDYYQGAPIGFLLIQKAVTNFIGEGEYALRLFPLLSGLLALSIFPFVARKYLTPRSALWATILFSFANPLIYYASEVKQYSVDVLATVLCLVIFLYMLERPLRVVDVIWLGSLGAALVWLSHPSVFVLAAAGLIITIICFRAGNRHKTILVLAVGFFWIASFLLSMLVSLESLMQDQVLLNYWQGGFISTTGSPIEVIEWLLDRFLSMFQGVLGLFLTGLAFALYLFGAFSMARRDKPRLFSLVLPIIFVVFASYLQRYPFSGRLILFLAPLVVLLLAEGIEQLLVLPNTRYQKVAILLAVFLLLFQPVKQTLDTAWYPRMSPQDIVPVIDYTHQNWREGDMVYVNYAAYPSFTFYLPTFPFPQDNIIQGMVPGQDWTEHVKDIDSKFSEHERVWLIFSRLTQGAGTNEEALLIDHLDRTGGLQIAHTYAVGSTAYLYEFSNRNESGIREQAE